MKKNLLIFTTVLITFSLMAFGYLSWSNTANNPADEDLFYNVKNRWSTITKEDLSKKKSIRDMINDEGQYTREEFRNVRVSILHNDKDVRDIKTSEVGQSAEFNSAQLEILQSIDYSTNIRITALNKRKDTATANVHDDSLVLYLTIIPETEAQYAGGFDALIDYLKESTKESTDIIKKDKLQPGKVFFTVTKNGTIADIELNSTSGYPTVDEFLIETIKNIPQKWDPATNSKGEKVDQEFVFFFGVEGC
jgi:hypothetical protein